MEIPFGVADLTRLRLVVNGVIQATIITQCSDLSKLEELGSLVASVSGAHDSSARIQNGLATFDYGRMKYCRSSLVRAIQKYSRIPRTHVSCLK